MRTTASHRVGVVTGEAAPELTDDGQVLLSGLEDRGLEVRPVVWNDGTVDWAAFDALLVRSCWEYYTRPDAFRDWVRAVTEADVTLLNPDPLLRWNMHKFYLRDLEREGVDVLPTAYVDDGTDADLGTVLDERGWTDAVVEPAVGTSSHDVWRVSGSPTDEDRTRFDAALADGDLLVQPFAPEIDDGELSLVYFGGAYSHANRSVPASDDFRAHRDYGTTLERASPPRAVIDRGRRILETAAGCCGFDRDDVVYARVDRVVRDGGFRLPELELIEPYLALSMHDHAAARFADAVTAALQVPTAEPRGEPDA